MSSYGWYIADGTTPQYEAYNYTYGIDVRISKSIKVTALLAKIYAITTGATISARIYKLDGTLIASGPGSAPPSGWQGLPLSSAVILEANTTYRICVYLYYSQTVTAGLYRGVYSPVTTNGVTLTVPAQTIDGYGYMWQGAGDVFPQTNGNLNLPYAFSLGIASNSIEPNTPSNLSPVGTSSSPSIQNNLTPVLTWGYTDPDTDGSQSAYQVIIKKASDNSIVKDTGKVMSGSNTYTVPTGTLQTGTIYYWIVNIWDNTGLKNSTSPTTQYFRTIAQPTISGNANEALGNKNVPFAITYSVNDADSADSLNVVEKLNGNQINSLSNAPRNINFTINITKEILNSLPLNQQSTILISVTDGTTTTYKTITFTRTNSGPGITNLDKDLGQVAREGITEKYTCHDVEGNTFTIVEKVDDIEIKNIPGVDGNEYTINIPLNIWFALKNGTHKYTITATDSLGASIVRTFTFTKKETVIESTGLANIVPTDVAATKIILTPNWIGEENVDPLFEVCNNAYDAIPTWENATSQTLLNKSYIFTNKVKTGTKWGIDIRFKLTLKSGVTDNIEFYGLGGAFE